MKYEVNFNCVYCGQVVKKTTSTSGNSQTKETCPHCRKRNSVMSVKNELKKVGK